MGENGVSGAAKSAQDLLAEFQQTGSQQPFEEIARRYAGMVYNVALRVTRDGHDAEDATQATFLTLAVHAKTAGKIRYLGPWLKKVSHRLALDIRRSKKRRTAREQRHAEGNGHGNGEAFEPPASNGLQSEELRLILREEIDKLPAKYRMPLILYYFGGLSPEEMSKELQCNTSTLGVRLHRGRKMLADSLTGRGISMNAAIVAAALSKTVDNFIRDNLIHACSHGAVHLASTGRAVADVTVATPVVSLMRSVTAAMRWSKLKIAVSVALALMGTFAGASEVLQRYDVINQSLIHYLNPLRLLRPLMDRINVVPRFSSATSSGSEIAVPSENESPKTDWIPSYATNVGSPLEFPGNYSPLNVGPIETNHSATPGVSSTSSTPVQDDHSFTLATSSVAGLAFPNVVPTSVAAPKASGASLLSSGPASASAQARTSNSNIIASGPAGFIIDRAVANPSVQGSKFLFDGDFLQTPRLVVGEASTGTLVQTRGSIKADEVVVADQKSSRASIEVRRGSLHAAEIKIGNAGHGTLTQLSGHIVASSASPGTLTLGVQPGSSGTYFLRGGDMFADTLTVGAEGTGQVDQTGGTASASVAQLGAYDSGAGTYNLNGGNLMTVTPSDPSIVSAVLTSTSASPMPPPSAVVAVGLTGQGTLVINQTSSDPIISEKPGTQGSNLIIRSASTGSGTIKGFGTVAVTGSVINNDRIIADGNGAAHTLDLSAASRVSNTIDNPAQHGTSGFFAQNGGSLKLPKIKVTGDYYYNWGEDSFDDSIDLVNSVRFRPDIGSDPGYVDITLIDPKAKNLPALPGGRSAVGLWSLASTVDMDSVNLMIRYDDALAGSMKLSESGLALWAYENGAWQVVSDYSGIDTTRHLLWGRANGDPTYFAAAPLDGSKMPISQIVPEPSIFGLGIFGIGSLLLKRRRR